MFLIEFREGLLIRASSDRSPKGQRLGDLLVKQGALEQDEVAELVKEARDHSRYLGSHLLQTAASPCSSYGGALATQVQALFCRLMESDNAIYRFQEGNALTNAHDFEMNVTHLLLEGARVLDERERERDSTNMLEILEEVDGTPGVSTILDDDEDEADDSEDDEEPEREAKADGNDEDEPRDEAKGPSQGKRTKHGRRPRKDRRSKGQGQEGRRGRRRGAEGRPSRLSGHAPQRSTRSTRLRRGLIVRRLKSPALSTTRRTPDPSPSTRTT